MCRCGRARRVGPSEACNLLHLAKWPVGTMYSWSALASRQAAARAFKHRQSVTHAGCVQRWSSGLWVLVRAAHVLAAKGNFGWTVRALSCDGLPPVQSKSAAVQAAAAACHRPGSLLRSSTCQVHVNEIDWFVRTRPPHDSTCPPVFIQTETTNLLIPYQISGPDAFSVPTRVVWNLGAKCKGGGKGSGAVGASVEPTARSSNPGRTRVFTVANTLRHSYVANH